jgi:iron complex transport system substrate-binding protein
VFSYDPMTLDGVFEQIEALDRAVQPDRSGPSPAVDQLRARVDAVSDRVAERDRPRVLLLEWTDPPFTPGHWIPDQIVRAGGEPIMANPGGRSSATTWDEVAESAADVLLVAPCGFDQAAAEAQLRDVLARPEVASLPAARHGRAHAVDADGLIVRPGPRLVDGVEALAELFHPSA